MGAEPSEESHQTTQAKEDAAVAAADERNTDAWVSVMILGGGCLMFVLMTCVITWVTLMALSQGPTPPGGQCSWWDAYCSETPLDADPLDYLSHTRRQEVLSTRLYNIIEHEGTVYGAILNDLNTATAAKYNFTVTMLCVGLPPNQLLAEETVEVRGGGHAEIRLKYDEELVTEDVVPCGLYLSGYLPYKGYEHIYYVYSEHIFYST